MQFTTLYTASDPSVEEQLLIDILKTCHKAAVNSAIANGLNGKSYSMRIHIQYNNSARLYLKYDRRRLELVVNINETSFAFCNTGWPYKTIFEGSLTDPRLYELAASWFVQFLIKGGI